MPKPVSRPAQSGIYKDVARLDVLVNETRSCSLPSAADKATARRRKPSDLHGRAVKRSSGRPLVVKHEHGLPTLALEPQWSCRPCIVQVSLSSYSCARRLRLSGVGCSRRKHGQKRIGPVASARWRHFCRRHVAVLHNTSSTLFCPSAPNQEDGFTCRNPVATVSGRGSTSNSPLQTAAKRVSLQRTLARTGRYDDACSCDPLFPAGELGHRPGSFIVLVCRLIFGIGVEATKRKLDPGRSNSMDAT